MKNAFKKRLNRISIR